jgi:BASS family bile acid:Na+ symporter
MIARISGIIQQLLLIWLVLFSVVAYFWIDLAGVDSLDPFAATRPALGLMISLTMFCIGCLITVDEIDEVFRRWPTVLGGTAIQYSVMPLLAWGCGTLLGLEREYLIGVIVVGCVPGAMASNVLTLAARGNVSYSISLTTSATILSPLIVPLAFQLTLSAFVEIDPAAEAVKLLQRVVGPVVIGHLLCRFWSPVARGIQPLAPIVANATIVWIIAVVVALNRDRLADAFSGHAVGAGSMLLALLVINGLGYSAGYGGGRALRLPEPMRRALTLEVGMQNAGLGTFLVLDLFENEPAAAIPTAVYTFGCMLTGTMLAQWWGWNDRREAGDVPGDGESPVTPETEGEVEVK